ncbi:RnfABCDGE type electron transport complex subunit D [Alicyclobacillus sendaiensis]|uniref:RnfABCDGE type electron transport complex subunit D n=1 Tax=Alicyclobacillus sendaiensis PA2 TaxID=3029425 RepID=A0ABT6XVZ8_ALISE|nr:RnfABCDGE type electron transport complex subunit D [Alicyclobacillus sendaiensis]MDI9258992.1 RnfABCDGE type electron transport complex subunit D [Alicyclobacillus sendaiensis PA2]
MGLRDAANAEMKRSWRRMSALLRRPKSVCAGALFALAVLAVAGGQPPRGLLQVAMAVAAAALVDLALRRLRGLRLGLPDGALVTGAIVGLILSADSPLWLAPAVAAISIASKHGIRVRHRHIFNPAAVGLLLAAASGASESWWGDLAGLSLAYVAVLVAFMYAVLWRARKFATFFAYVASFLAVCFAAGAMHSALGADAFRNPILNATLFAAGFMASDPPTSPSRLPMQVAYGAGAGGLAAALYLWLSGLAYPFVALLAANATYAAVRLRLRVLQSARREET